MLIFITINITTEAVTPIFLTRKVGRPPAGQFSTTCGELVAFGHLEGPLGPLDSCMESCIVRDHSC